MPRTLSYHCVKLLSGTKRLELKPFSASETFELYLPIKKGKDYKDQREKRTSIEKRLIKMNTTKNKKIEK